MEPRLKVPGMEEVKIVRKGGQTQAALIEKEPQPRYVLVQTQKGWRQARMAPKVPTPRARTNLLKGRNRNRPCPCGSGLKVKQCHPNGVVK